MIVEVYGFPVYKGKFSEKESVLHYIQECKLNESDRWNASCLTSSDHGSKHINAGDNKCISDDIYKEIVKHALEMMKELNINLILTPSRCRKKECHDCRDVWINRYTNGHGQNVHWHVDYEHNPRFSFTYFAKYDSRNDAKFVFVNPIPPGVCTKEMSKHPAFSEDMSFNVEEGDIIIFPCWLLHYVTMQRSEGPRITMSGNLYEMV